MNANTMQLDGMNGYGLGRSDTLQTWVRKADAQAFAKAQGWNKSDVVRVHYRNFWVAWAVGQMTAPGTFRGFDCNSQLVDVQILPPKY